MFLAVWQLEMCREGNSNFTKSQKKMNACCLKVLKQGKNPKQIVKLVMRKKRSSEYSMITFRIHKGIRLSVETKHGIIFFIHSEFMTHDLVNAQMTPFIKNKLMKITKRENNSAILIPLPRHPSSLKHGTFEIHWNDRLRLTFIH